MALRGAAVVLLAVAAMPLGGQIAAPDSSIHASSPTTVNSAVPARPALLPGADTNSAQQYFQAGMQLAYTRPNEAAHAFYWAFHLDPSSGDALYGLHSTSVLAMDEKELGLYLNLDKKKKRDPKYAALDSMELRAYAMNPFVFSSMDPVLLRRALQTEIWYEHPHASPQEVSFAVARVMGGEMNFAWLQYSQNHLPQALETYAKILADPTTPRWVKAKDSVRVRKHREALAAAVHTQRGKIFYLLDDMDSAATEMNAALAGLREHDDDDKSEVFFYRSKAVYQQSLGMIYQRANKLDLAREAYGRALEEDLSFFAAHTHLAQLDLLAHDTVGAIAEMDLAAQLNPGDPVVHYEYAEILVHAGRDADAAGHLRKAIALDPYYGAPHLLLALIADVEQYTDDAKSEYAAFVSVASRKDGHLHTAQARLKELSAIVASNPPKQ